MLKCREQGIYKSILFWYKIKPIYQTGVFLRKDFIKIVQSFYNISEANIYLHLSKLKKLGLIIPFKEYYKLVSYDKLFSKFGYNLQLKWKSGKIVRKGNFAIDKISIDDIDVIKDRIDCGEIKLNLRRQEYHLKKVSLESMPNILKGQQKVERNNHSFIFDGSNIVLSRNSLLNVKDNLTVLNNQKKVYTVVGLSCKGLCKLLGFKSTKTVHNFKHRCNNYGLMLIQQQKILFKKSCNILDEVLLKYKLRPVNYCFTGSFGKELNYRLHDSFIFNF